MSWFLPDALFDGAHLHTGRAVRIEDGVVVEVGPPPAGETPEPLTGTLTPGFVDLQVNGGGGVLFNADPTPEAIADIIAAHRGLGTVGLLPTVITDAPEVLARAVDALLAAWPAPGLLGIHIEGPHLSQARRGTHAACYVRPFEAETLAHVTRLRAAGIPVLITVAPEAVNPQQVAALAGTGAVVSIGHTDASAEEARSALEAGASCFTHLYNAMSPMLNRAPGVVGAAINSTAHAGIICDGIHVADEMVGLALRARPARDRMFLISDAMPTVGGPESFTLYGQEIRVQEGRLVNAEGSLAGAHTTMAESLARLIRVLGVAPEQALRMAITVPARLIGQAGYATLEGRAMGDVLLLGPDWAPAGTLAELAPA